MVKIRFKNTISLFIFLTLCLPFLSQARTIKEVVISQVGLALEDSSPNVPEECKNFRPTVKQVWSFFKKSYPVENYILNHERYSPCYAKGTVVFSDGGSGEWWLYSGGTASLVWSRGGKVNLYYEHNKWHDPFAGMYGLDDGSGN